MKIVYIAAATALILILGAWMVAGTDQVELAEGNTDEPKQPDPVPTGGLRNATFAGGCFWCIESAFEVVDGVTGAISGYTGGDVPNPTYKQVITGNTAHLEAVQVFYKPSEVTYGELLDVFWRSIDPTDPDGQFADRGSQYRTAIFYNSEEQRLQAEQSKMNLAGSGKFTDPIVTDVLPLAEFYKAENYHQDYYLKQKYNYEMYAKYSGREDYIEETWSNEEPAAWRDFQKPSDEELKQTLNPLQYEVTQNEGTETAFNNTYWNNKKDGIYVDILSGEPLFSSRHKYVSGTGWPSFYEALHPENLTIVEEYYWGIKTLEVRSSVADSHLGHVFNDGPEPTGLRYCLNSAALRFIPVEELADQGYGEYLSHFDS